MVELAATIEVDVPPVGVGPFSLSVAIPPLQTLVDLGSWSTVTGMPAEGMLCVGGDASGTATDTDGVEHPRCPDA